MEQPLHEAILTSIVGMLTVFIILLVIVVSGYFLMKILEKTNFIFNKENDVPDQGAQHLQVIGKAITQWSGGSATVKNIKKLD